MEARIGTMEAEKRIGAEEGGRRVEAYLRRVGFFDGSEAVTRLPEPTPETLRRLHTCQVRNVVFENLDQHIEGRHIVLRSDVLYDKIVVRRRGGFCFELNGLYADMLRELGFRDVSLYSARVWDRDKQTWTRLTSHVVTVVRFHNADGGEEEAWLSDVGYGACPHVALRFGDAEEQEGDAEWAAFRLSRVEGESSHDPDPRQPCVMVERKSRQDGTWHKAILIYALQPRTLEDLTPHCDALQAEQTSHLTQRILITRVDEKERRTMSGAHRLIVTSFADGQRTERNIMIDEKEQSSDQRTEKEAYLDVLAREFGLRLTPDEERALDLEKSKSNAHVW